MRTYIEWLHEAEFQLPTANRYNNDYPAMTEKIIKQIQRDAWRQGMLDAIEITNEYEHELSDEPNIQQTIQERIDDPEHRPA